MVDGWRVNSDGNNRGEALSPLPTSPAPTILDIRETFWVTATPLVLVLTYLLSPHSRTCRGLREGTPES